MKSKITIISKVLILNIVACIFSLSFGEGWGEAASAQVPTASGSYQWVKGFGSFNQQGITDEMVNAMKLDNEGNTIVCGRVMGYTNVQGLGGKKDSLISNRWQNANNFQGFISKYDCNGNVLWYKELNDSMSNTDIYDFVVDANNNIYVFGKCNAGNRATYFDDSLFAPYTIPNTVIGPPVLFSLTENGKMRWNWIPPYVNAFSRLYITPQFQNHSGNVMCNTMVLHHDTINLLAFTSPLSSTPLLIGSTIFKRGYNIIRFNLSGQLLDAVRIDSNNAVFNGFGIDKGGNFLASFNFEDTVVNFLDSVFYRSTTSDFNPLSTIIKFNRTHVIRHIEFGDSTGGGGVTLLGNNQFCTTVSGYTNRYFYGNNKFKAKSGFFGNQTTTGGPCIFNDLTSIKWFAELDTSTYGGAITLGDVDVNGDVYANWSSIHYQKFRTLSDNLPNNDVKNYPVKLSYINGDPILKYAEVNTPITKNYSNQAYFQNFLIDKQGNLILGGNLSNNQVIVGIDTAKYYGGNNDMFVMRYGNPCSNTATMIAAGTPSGLLAACNGKTSIHIKWDLLKNGEDKYYIYRSLAATSGFAKIDSVMPTTNTYTDANVVTKTNYWYAISSHNVVGEGYLSQTDSARLCDDTLGGFTSTIDANHQLQIYPNPVSNVLICKCANMLINTIEVTNVLGQNVLAVTPSPLERAGVRSMGDVSIDVLKLSSGIYFIKTTDKNGNVLNGKFVKE
jgi:hypothetical protein